MANTKEIQKRMKSIQDTMKITNAMYMISSSKLRVAKQKLEDTEPYFYSLQMAIARFLDIFRIRRAVTLIRRRRSRTLRKEEVTS